MTVMRSKTAPTEPGVYQFHDGASSYPVRVFERNGELWQAHAEDGRGEERVADCLDAVCSWSAEPIEWPPTG